jgi:hypothetical protein
MILPHHRPQTLLELAEQVAEPTVAVAIRMLTAIFFPEQQQVYARALQFAGKRRPIRLGTAARPLLHAGPAEQPLLEHCVGEVGRQGPGQSGRSGPPEIVLDRAARSAEHAPDLTRTDAVVGQPQ